MQYRADFYEITEQITKSGSGEKKIGLFGEKDDKLYASDFWKAECSASKDTESHIVKKASKKT